MPNPRVFFDININDKPTGRIEMELFSDTTPLTAENFRALCTGETGFGISRKPLHYKGSTFHRVKPGSWCQGGDITVGDGSGGESIYGARFDNENYINKHTGMGILSMVNHNGTSCNKSQFIIYTANTSWLDGKCVAFGKVVKGFDVLKAMENVGSVSGKTSVPVVIADCGQLSLSPTQSMKEIKQVISNFNQGVSIKLKRSREEFKHTWVDNVELLDTASPEKIKEATHDSMMEVEEVLELEENVKQYLKHLSEMKKELCLYEKELLDTQTKIKNIMVRNLFVDAIPSMSYEELSVIEKVIKKLKTGNP